MIDCLSARLSFILGIHGNLGRQTAELIADVPAALMPVQCPGLGITIALAWAMPLGGGSRNPVGENLDAGVRVMREAVPVSRPNKRAAALSFPIATERR